MTVPIKTVEFMLDVRGPWPRQQSDMTATYTTMRVRPGEKDPSPTGLSIEWDTESHAISIEKAGTQEDPVVVYPWHLVRRVIPDMAAIQARSLETAGPPPSPLRRGPGRPRKTPEPPVA